MTDRLEPLPRGHVPFPREHYERLVRERDGFATVSETVVRTSGYGFRVAAGQAFRFTLSHGPQVLDVGMLSTDDPYERLFPGTQMAIEGGRIGRFTRLWGTPPRTRPLATCIADTVRRRPTSRGTAEHFPHGAHCNPHLWHLYDGHHGRSCYDNLRYALTMVGLHQRCVHDNVNLFMKGAIDPWSGASIADESDARQGDAIEFYAEMDLTVIVSLCSVGGGSDDLRDSWESGTAAPRVHPITVSVLDTGIAPLGWPLDDEEQR